MTDQIKPEETEKNKWYAVGDVSLIVGTILVAAMTDMVNRHRGWDQVIFVGPTQFSTVDGRIIPDGIITHIMVLSDPYAGETTH